ncbi:uncharacterized protein LOC121425051 [Lytechinus variegatus]|uniref:uncharacterized protein LOC121425051 n=1 Tax=Lytechinus variegatus TaxID=7654 RepID=UPI001BB26183|nr:uncharacterized protein LOC121425051 [Lytechinus variegatus]XP_041476936.1 uncharacterized protein LOC121425051 [Lytechinus variegatus]XP_041476937.1 uncharacterized protein LOC121425051 [Lytechinus variegatus]
MNTKEKQCLQSVHDLILRDVRACDVQDYLFETSVLNLDDLTSLEEEKNPKKQLEMILKCVNDRPDSFQHFSDALRDRHPYILQEMEKAQVSAFGHISSASQQPVCPTKNYEIIGDGNFVVAESENTRVHMKRRDVPTAGLTGPEPS